MNLVRLPTNTEKLTHMTWDQQAPDGGYGRSWEECGPASGAAGRASGPRRRGQSCTASVRLPDALSRPPWFSQSRLQEDRALTAASGSTFLHDVEPDAPWLHDDVRGVLDITDIRPVVYRLHIFYVDRRIPLVEVSSPADSILERWVIPGIHLPLGVVQKLQLEERTRELFPKADALGSVPWKALEKHFIQKYIRSQISSYGTYARQGFRSHRDQSCFS